MVSIKDFKNFIFNINFYSIVMEYCDNGDLFQKICDHKKDKGYFKEK